MILDAPVNAADLVAAAYGRRKPRYPVIAETVGLAVVLLANRNTARDRAVWLAHSEVSNALCLAAEAFAETLIGKPSPVGWRGGALAGLRSLVPGALHEVVEPWPWPAREDAAPPLTPRFWLDDDDEWFWPPPYFRRERPAVRVEVARRITGQPRAEAAWDAIQETMDGAYGDRGYQRRLHWRGVLAGWSSLHERPASARDLRAEIIEGRDVAAERDARWAEMTAAYSGTADGASDG